MWRVTESVGKKKKIKLDGGVAVGQEITVKTEESRRIGRKKVSVFNE